MAYQADLKLLAAGSADIIVGPVPALGPEPRGNFFANDATGTADIVVCAAGDGVPSHRFAALVGQRATATAGAFQFIVALTGLRATTTPGIAQRYLGIDTFTGVNGTLLGAHTADTGQSWTRVTTTGGIGDAQIQTNRLQQQNGEYDSVWYLGTESPECGMAQAEVRYAGPSNDDTYPHEMVGGRVDGTTGDGYFFGYWVVTGKFTIFKYASSQLWDYAGGITPRSPSGTEQHTIRCEVYGTGPVYVRAYVDDVLEATYVDTDNTTWITAGHCGLRLGGFDGISAGTTREWTLPTFWYGQLASTGFMVGQVATTAQGTITPTAGGSTTSVALTGLALTTTPGTFPAVGTIGELVGRRLTLTPGVLSPIIAIGAYDSSIIALLPTIAATVSPVYGSGDWYRPHNMTYQLAATGDKLRGSGWEYLPTFVADGSRIGNIFADPIGKVWASGSISSSFGSASADSMNADGTIDVGTGFPQSIAWPRFFTPYGAPLIFNDWDVVWSARDPNGNIHTGTLRKYVGYGRPFQPWDSQDPTVYQFGWQSLDITTFLAPLQRYNGPEFAVSRVGSFYPYESGRAAAFYNVRNFASGGNASVELVGLRIHGYLPSSNNFASQNSGTPSPAGLRITTTQGVLRPANELYVYDAGGFPTHRAVLRAGVLGVINSSDITNLGFRTTQYVGTSWSNEVVLSAATGTGPLQPNAKATFIPSGHPDIFYVVYASEIPNGFADSGFSSFQVYDVSIGLAVVNIALREVYSNQVVFAASVGNLYQRNTQKAVADVVVLADGRRFTQFLFFNQVVHVAWQYRVTPNLPGDIICFPVMGGATIRCGVPAPFSLTTPVVTIKALAPNTLDYGPLTDTEAFEYRGERAYHVMYSVTSRIDLGGGSFGSPAFPVSLSRVHINDVTSASSAWVVQAATGTGAEHTYAIEGPHMNTRAGVKFLGSGGGKPSVFFWAGGAPTIGHTDTSYQLWLDFWNAQPPLLSVSAEGQVGHVTVFAIPNLQLVGQRITTRSGVLTPSTRALVGLRTTLARGDVTPFADSFIALTGLRTTMTAGVMGKASVVALTGQAATTAASAMTPLFPIWLVGFQTTTAKGALTPSSAVSVALTGLVATCTGGALVPGTSKSVQLTGQVATATSGTVVATVTVLAPGLGATARQGAVIPLVTVTPLGQAVVSSPGVAQVLLNIALTGRSGTTSAGSLGTAAVSIATLVGQRATCRQGTIFFNPPDAGVEIFATTYPPELTATTGPDEDFVVVVPAF